MGLLNSVSNKSVCDWFYLMFIINCVASAVMLVRLVTMIIYTKPGLLLGSLTFFIMIIAVAVPVINGAFFYALCDRALKPEVPVTPLGYPVQDF